MSVDLSSLQTQAASYLDKLGIEYEKLTKDELDLFQVSFTRQFILSNPYREVADILVRHQREILMGAMVAKAQMDTSFDGMFPGSNKFGMTEIRAAYLGVGDDWDDIYRITNGTPYWTPGEANNWIHSGTTYLGGTAGNPIRFYDNLVCVIVGIASEHPSPKLESVYFEIDGKPKPIVPCRFSTRKKTYDAFPVKELDDAILLYKGKEFLAKVFFSDAGGTVSQVIDYPYPVGVAFIKEPALRVLDPYNLIGTAAARDANLLVKPT